MRVGHGRTEHERVEEICRWIEHKGPVVSTGFEVTADFTGAPEGAYDTQSGHTTPRGLHAVVIDGWKKMPYGQWAWLVKNSWGDRLNHKEVPFGQDGIDAGVLGIPRFPLGYPAPSPIPRWRLAISGEPLCGPWRERDSTDSTSYHLCYYVERQTGERRLAFVATPGPDLCKCCVLPITSQARETGVHEGNGWLTEEFMDNSLLSSLGVRPDESGILWVSVRLRVTGEDELELSFKRQDRGYTMFVYERVRFSGSREGRSTLKELQSPVAPSYQPVYVVGEEGGGCGVPSPMLCD
ncbi:unnamed protein product [Vitrella brassicaformis CCMP3155]|uniref:Peptidase C1A papain C-terminal domain-containing protein n=2 Tax=Vitrella brassicaformis TaxID=1169539 RepID=A0A0G4GBD3_VITBC|nr:unnamed protein product [Vitrella brassicaformis CCMP3155]|eukprot:CEM26271.1 unnamed protein product [Vitrella brassicaformis CCMP3155]